MFFGLTTVWVLFLIWTKYNKHIPYAFDIFSWQLPGKVSATGNLVSKNCYYSKNFTV